ncbi:hypothetical protein AAW50_03540 [Mycoplasmopsis canis]|uniref:hypothetical protein n=1 Tax=Mycoplasmopsis canis TaxID=29555 RepID=UPI00062469AD|nr:hypothetical protein [Mycoplasmopsis canis]AKF41023.1 hypothetical protein AAW50_01035 [Mycoplasmopsis canis]AKF41462.1 hypothetical protein AAW50_03540 [Mycoplasmopsis canis]
MTTTLINALASGGVGAFLILIAFIVHKLVKKIKSGNNHTQSSNNNNSININNQGTDDVHDLLKNMICTNSKNLSKLDEKVNSINNKLEKLSLALVFYVSNNGVSDEVKKEFKEIIKGE